MKYLLTNIRHFPHRSCSIYHPPQSTRRNPLRPHRSINTVRHQGVTLGPQIARFYSTSNSEIFKADAPIGVCQNSGTAFQLDLLGLRIGESYNRLSRHVNLYFKKKQVETIPSRRVQNDAGSGETTEQIQEAHPALQLFHISSLASRFGESFSYVAKHINSAFSRKSPKQIHMGVSVDEGFRRSRSRKRIVISKSVLCEETVKRPSSEIENNVSSSWEEGYLHFARHINKYFGAKVADNEHQMLHTETNVHKTSDPKTKGFVPGLFHINSLTTCFGENYTYMANHINQYFKGSAATENEEVDGELEHYRHSPEMLQEKTLSFFENLLNPSAIPGVVGSYLGMGSGQRKYQNTTVTRTEEEMLDAMVLRRRRADEITGVLLNKLEKARVPSSFRSCLEELNAHLIQHPACKAVVWQEKAAPMLLSRRRVFLLNEKLQEAIRETLALIGYVDPVKGCGVRMLSIDGGGTKGLVPLQVLKELEARTGKRVYQLFDYICGVSTGAVLSFMLGLARFSLEECEEMYHRFGTDVFRQNPLVGTVKMGWTHSYYNTTTWERILREKLGEDILIKTARDEESPKVSAVSAVVNWGKSPKAFIFRNYNHAPEKLSRYAGGSGYKLWQAVRASSAAPGYFQEFPLHGDIHQDGGLILNNPCALAVHESRLLWPHQPFQCVVSLGTGRYDNARRGPATSTSLRAKISNLICSATDTEGVHTLLDDLLPSNVYFRFNPMLSSNVTLDESRPEVFQQLQKDTQLYLDRNQAKLEQLSTVLMAERTAIWKTRDWINEKAWELQQRWT